MKALLFFLLLSGTIIAQQKYLVSPNDEVIPLRRGESPRSIMAKRTGNTTSSTLATCGTRFTFGYSETLYPATSNFGARHKDVMGEWFVAKATGTIDTLFWETLGSVGALDSTLYLRIFNSRIGPTYGPGVRPGLYGPPCQNWGYYVNTNDHDQGIAAFKEDATDTTWHSTIAGSVPPTLPPFLNVILGGFAGIAYTDHAGQINHAALQDIGVPLNITVGQQFFVTLRVKGPDAHPDPLDGRTEFAASGFHVDKSDESYPSRNWKFYEHDSGPSNCAGIPAPLVKRGWVARGGFTDDSLDVALFNFWYTMTVTTNAPPDVIQTEILHNTFDTGTRLFAAVIVDCDPAVPARAGVKQALVKWFLNNVSQPDLVMSHIGGDQWEAMLPGEPAGSTITYKVYAEDSTGSFSTGLPISYGIFQLSNGFVLADTAGPCTSKSIRSTGVEIDTSKFFLPPVASIGATKLDDGSAGPIDMGSNMPLFGDVGRYVWVGINGAIAISKTETDTFDVNANGLFATDWSFPQSSRHGGRKDTANGGAGLKRMPGNFFAPFWTDLWYGNGDFPQKCGRILHQKGLGGDSCLFIVEWDSLGFFYIPRAQNWCDEVTFRVVLNKCTGVIEYQYDDVGTLGEETVALVGFQADSTALTVPNQALNGNPAFVLVNDNGYPLSTRPRNGWCMKFYPATINPAVDGWNLISVSMSPVNGDFRASTLFPTAISRAYTYKYGKYVYRDTLRIGEGYWLKLSGPQNIGAHGSLFFNCIIDTVDNGWNLIGTPSGPVPKATIYTSGGGSVISNYFTYDGGYYNANILFPGHGYWVKMGGAGTLTLCGGLPFEEPKMSPQSDQNMLNKITISASRSQTQMLYIGEESLVKEPLDMYELPPAMPEFDARFASGRMVETYPAHPDANVQYEYPIRITSGKPVTIQWNIVSGAEGKLALSAGGKKLARLEGTGKIALKYEDMKDVKLTLGDGVDLPKVFGLSQNYPNPFNPSTEIRYQIAAASHVVLKVYDLLGREVVTLVNETEDVGYKSVRWNAETIASGMYIYKLTATSTSDRTKSFVEVKKMMLVR
jgi:hypothetical protein